jgi:hypothetical protein
LAVRRWELVNVCRARVSVRMVGDFREEQEEED